MHLLNSFSFLADCTLDNGTVIANGTLLPLENCQEQLCQDGKLVHTREFGNNFLFL